MSNLRLRSSSSPCPALCRDKVSLGDMKTITVNGEGGNILEGRGFKVFFLIVGPITKQKMGLCPPSKALLKYAPGKEQRLQIEPQITFDYVSSCTPANPSDNDLFTINSMLRSGHYSINLSNVTECQNSTL